MSHKLLNELTVLFPTIHSQEFAEIVIRSFEKFKPYDLNVKYIVVENSNDISYREHTIALAHDVLWIQNPIDMSIFPYAYKGSCANASGIECGLEKVTTEYVFIAHSDVCVTSSTFFDELRASIVDNVLVGTVRDNVRLKSIHVSGYLIPTDIVKHMSFMPILNDDGSMIADVGDCVDIFCQQQNMKTFCYRNTENDAQIENTLSDPFKSFHVDRCLNSNGDVMFMHLGRGYIKMLNIYNKPNRVLKDEWVTFCRGMLK